MMKRLSYVGVLACAVVLTASASSANAAQVQGFACDVEDPGGATARFVQKGAGKYPLVVTITNPSCYAGAIFPQGVAGKPANSLSYYITPDTASGTFYPLLKYNYNGYQQTVSLGYSSFASLPKGGKQMTYNMQALGVPKGATINELAIYVQEYSGNAKAELDTFSVNGTAITNKVLATAPCPSF
ncbi:MAG TPA: hypothetical protein V6C89_10085 [Drouetiella sp.]|jgi:hypothetical protein